MRVFFGNKLESETIVNTKKKESLRSYGGTAAFFLFLLVCVAFFAGFLPIAPVAVATGSMEPTIYAGDVVLICQTDSSQLEVGDIIQYRKDDYTVIHRIIECKTEENEIIGFITKGDYNNGPDSEVVLPEQVIGRVIEVIPGAGKFTLWLHNQLYAV